MCNFLGQVYESIVVSGEDMRHKNCRTNILIKLN